MEEKQEKKNYLRVACFYTLQVAAENMFIKALISLLKKNMCVCMCVSVKANKSLISCTDLKIEIL